MSQVPLEKRINFLESARNLLIAQRDSSFGDLQELLCQARKLLDSYGFCLRGTEERNLLSSLFEEILSLLPPEKLTLSQKYDRPVTAVDFGRYLDVRIQRGLNVLGISHLGYLEQATEADLLRPPGFGILCIDAVKKELEKYDFILGRNNGYVHHKDTAFFQTVLSTSSEALDDFSPRVRNSLNFYTSLQQGIHTQEPLRPWKLKKMLLTIPLALALTHYKDF